MTEEVIYLIQSQLMEEVSSFDEEGARLILEPIPALAETEDNIRLLRPVSLKEVKKAVFHLNPSCAAGSDGFNGKFYQHCWDVIAVDLFQTIVVFFASVPIPRSIGSTLMVLLPKKESPTTFGDFWPISLCTFINKIFTRILCDCMQDLMPRLIP